MYNKDNNTRRGIPIRAINIGVGDHMPGKFSVCFSWWIGGYDPYHEMKFGNKTYWNVSRASVWRVSKFILGENNA